MDGRRAHIKTCKILQWIYGKVKYDENIFKKKFKLEEERKSRKVLEKFANYKIGAEIDDLRGAKGSAKVTRVLKKAAKRKLADFERQASSKDLSNSEVERNAMKENDESDESYSSGDRKRGTSNWGYLCNSLKGFFSCLYDLMLANFGDSLEACLWWLDSDLGGHFYSPASNIVDMPRALMKDAYRFISAFEEHEVLLTGQ